MMTKSDQIIQFIREAGSTGRKFTEIQRFIVELNGHNYDEMEVHTHWFTKKEIKVRRWRGYWCTHLTGGGINGCYGRGMLRDRGCFKNDQGR
jgi:hypothetical protein